MKTEKLQNWLQIVGMVAVVASLVFVGLQLKQSHEIAIASQYQARNDAASSHYTSILQSDPSLRVIGSDLLMDLNANNSLPVEFKAWASAQPSEELAFRLISAAMFLKSHDNVHFQYQAGFLSDEAWRALRLQLKAGLHESQSWSRSVFENNPEVWRDSYQKLIQELLLEGAG